MSTGTVSLHSWSDGAEQDDADPPMGSNYNARLDRKQDWDRGRNAGGVRSHAVPSGPRRSARHAMDRDVEEGGGGGW
jgi:hypothetical protein